MSGSTELLVWKRLRKECSSAKEEVITLHAEAPADLLARAYASVENAFGKLPFKYRGIEISAELIRSVIELLNAEENKTLPQHSANAVVEKTMDGLDRRIKERMGSDLRTANIVSDVLDRAGIVKVINGTNPATGRNVKGTRLLKAWRW